jgi:hypothetical protein
MTTAPDYINGLSSLAISTAAATLSSTVIKQQLLPEQLAWVGVAGTVVAACMIAISFTFRQKLAWNVAKGLLSTALVVSCVGLVWLRASRVAEVQVQGGLRRYLVGSTLTVKGNAAQESCGTTTVEDLIGCSGSQQIPVLFGPSYWRAYYLYISDYLLLLTVFVPLVSTLDLRVGE